MDKRIYLDFRFYMNAKEVHAFLRHALDFPAYYGMNLDALYDVLTDMHENTELICRTSGKVFERGFLAVFRDAAEDNAHFCFTEE